MLFNSSRFLSTAFAVPLSLAALPSSYAQSASSSASQFFLHNPPGVVSSDARVLVFSTPEILRENFGTHGSVYVKCPPKNSGNPELTATVIDSNSNGVLYTEGINERKSPTGGVTSGEENPFDYGDGSKALVFKKAAQIDLGRMCPGGKVNLGELDAAIGRMMVVYEGTKRTKIFVSTPSQKSPYYTLALLP